MFKDVLKYAFLTICVAGGAIGGYSGGMEAIKEAGEIKNGIDNIMNARKRPELPDYDGDYTEVKGEET